MLRKLFSNKPAPLTGTPPIRRLKTYSAQSGYVYQYFFEGHRPFRISGETGTEYVFSVSPDRKRYAPVTVRVQDSAVQQWQTANSRELSSTECYAIAKLALFQAFDERPLPADMSSEIRVRNADLASIVQILEL